VIRTKCADAAKGVQKIRIFIRIQNDAYNPMKMGVICIFAKTAIFESQGRVAFVNASLSY
jgi:hypothetical protein